MNLDRLHACIPLKSKLQKLPMGSITANGWLREQLLRNKDGMGGHMDELEPVMIGRAHITRELFKIHPRLGECSPVLAAGWANELSATYWAGLIGLAYTLNDSELILKATTWVNAVLAAQEEDGYMGAYPKDVDRLDDFNPWGCSMLFRALLAFYEATGRKDVLDAVYCGLLWFCENWKDHKTDYAGSCIIESMIILYSYTGDKRLLQFSEDYMAWLEDNSKWPNKLSVYQSDDFNYVSMHAVAHGEECKNPALIYCATGNEEYLKASIKQVKKVLDHAVQLTGGISSNGEFLSPKGGSCETEYCNYQAYQATYYWMSMITGEASWGDEIERAIFNGAQGARKKDERAIAYFTSPNQLFANRESCIYGDWGEYGVYSPCFHVACCPAHSVMTIPDFVRGMVMQSSEEDFYLLCYSPVSVKAPKLEFTMDTMYPFRDTINLKIEKAEGVNLNIRIPNWCKAASAQINGVDVALIPSDSGFARINGKVKAGDTVTLRFPMEVVIKKVDDSDYASKFPMVIERGPLVYAIHVQENWVEYPGNPVTPLPEGWAWYEARPILGDGDRYDDVFLAYYGATFMKAIDENITPDQIKVIEHELDGYVWENPPVELEVPLYHAKHAYMFLSPRQTEPWGVPLRVEGEAQMATLVPHGCTNLRITYIPRAKL